MAFRIANHTNQVHPVTLPNGEVVDMQPGEERSFPGDAGAAHAGYEVYGAMLVGRDDEDAATAAANARGLIFYDDGDDRPDVAYETQEGPARKEPGSDHVAREDPVHQRVRVSENPDAHPVRAPGDRSAELAEEGAADADAETEAEAETAKAREPSDLSRQIGNLVKVAQPDNTGDDQRRGARRPAEQSAQGPKTGKTE